jgi:hypothetical protein
MQTVLEPQFAKIALLENGTTKLGKIQKIRARIVGRGNGPRILHKRLKVLVKVVLLQNTQIQKVLRLKILVSHVRLVSTVQWWVLLRAHA